LRENNGNMVGNGESKRCKEESGAYIKVVKIQPMLGVGKSGLISQTAGQQTPPNNKEYCQQSSSLFLGKIQRRVPPHSSARQKKDGMDMLSKKPEMRSSFLKANGTGVGFRFQRKGENAIWIKRKKQVPEPCR
jgi:hypothetical protein